MEPLIKVELSDITFSYDNHFVGKKNISINEFVNLEKKSKLKSVANNTTYLSSLLFIILFPITNLLISSILVLMIHLIRYFLTLYNFYDWYGLYNSLLEKGYDPNEINGYITVSKIDGGYFCQNGNHRMSMLNIIHNKPTKIEVREVPIIKG